MGCGKTTLACEVSRLTGLACLDTDQMVEKAAGMPVTEIFRRFGENTFRQFEYEAVLHLMQQEEFIAALGGGAVVYERNVQAIKSGGGVIIWVDTPLEVINARLQKDTSRPLLDADLEKRRILYQSRIPCYRAVADFRLDASQEEDLTAWLIEKFHLKT